MYDDIMEMPLQPLTPDAEHMLANHGGPLTLPSTRGDFIIMRPDVYAAMLGIGPDDEAETLAAVRRGLADLDAGRIQSLDEAFDEIKRRHGV